jgi:type I restriction enzyme, S subunit
MTLPKGWTKAKLGDFTLERVEQGEPGASAVPYIDIGSIDRDLKRVGPTEKVTGATAPTRARQWVRPGDVLVSLTRPNLNAVALVTPELDGAVASTGFDVLRPQSILSEWVFNRVRSQAFVSGVCEGVQGVVYPAIRPADVRRHDLPVPPAQEQRRIVDAIDSYLTRLDDAVASLERVQAKLKAYRASVLKAAVEGRLVPTEASLARAEKRTYEPAEVLLARILKERRRRWEEAELAKLKAAGSTPRDDKWKTRYREPTLADVGKLSKLPEGWCWASADAFFWDADYGTSTKCTVDAAGSPVLRIPNVEAGRISLDKIKYAAKDAGLKPDGGVGPNDFLFIRTNGSRSLIGRGALVVRSYDPAVHFASYLIRLRLVHVESAPEWFALAWHGPSVRDQLLRVAASSAGQHNVSLSAASSFVAPLPPLSEQSRILAEMDALTSAATKVEEQTTSDLRRCGRLRQAVLRWAFEGKLADQDPTDEPAERLIARIRAERAAVSPVRKTLSRRARGAA